MSDLDGVLVIKQVHPSGLPLGLAEDHQLVEHEHAPRVFFLALPHDEVALSQQAALLLHVHLAKQKGQKRLNAVCRLQRQIFCQSSTNLSIGQIYISAAKRINEGKVAEGGLERAERRKKLQAKLRRGDGWVGGGPPSPPQLSIRLSPPPAADLHRRP